MHEFVRAVISHTMDGARSGTDLFSHSSRGYKSEIKVSAGLVSYEDILCGLWPSSSNIFTWPPLCVPISSFYKDTTGIGSGPTPKSPFHLNYPFKGLPPSIVTFCGPGGIRTSTHGGGRVGGEGAVGNSGTNTKKYRLRTAVEMCEQ